MSRNCEPLDHFFHGEIAAWKKCGHIVPPRTIWIKVDPNTPISKHLFAIRWLSWSYDHSMAKCLKIKVWSTVIHEENIDIIFAAINHRLEWKFCSSGVLMLLTNNWECFELWCISKWGVMTRCGTAGALITINYCQSVFLVLEPSLFKMSTVHNIVQF